MPILELALFLKIGAKIGLAPTLVIIFITAVLGAWLTRSQGMQTLARFQQATAEGRLPHAEVLDGLMILLAGAVLLTPGFLTDTVGFLLLVPPVRAAVRARLGKTLKSRVHIVGSIPGTASDPAHGPFPPSGGQPTERVIDAKVIDEDTPS